MPGNFIPVTIFDRADNDAFRSIRLEDLKKKMRTPVLVDVKNFFDREEARGLGFRYVSL